MATNTATGKSESGAGTADGRDTNRGPVSISETAADLAGTARDTGIDIAKRSVGEIKDRAGEALAGQRESLATGLASISEGLKRTGEDLRKGDEQNMLTSTGADYLEFFGTKADSISGYVRNKDLAALADDLKQFARRNPALFIGGAFLAGVALTRFLKSGASSGGSRRSGAELGH